MPPRYQFLPDLDEETYAALKADIAEHGVLVPVIVDEEGNLLDGHNRVRACKELGLKSYPRIVRRDLSEAQKKAEAIRLNLHRRQMDAETRRELVGTLRQDGMSERAIADTLGASPATVHRDLQSGASCEAPEPPATVTGKDGKQYPAERVKHEPVSDPGWVCPGCRQQYTAEQDVCPACQPPLLDTESDPQPEPLAESGAGGESPPVTASLSVVTPEPAPEPNTVQRVLDVAGDADGALARQQLRAYYSTRLKVVRELLCLDPDAVAETFDDGLRLQTRVFCKDMRAWCDRLDAAMSRGIRLISEGDGQAHG